MTACNQRGASTPVVEPVEPTHGERADVAGGARFELHRIDDDIDLMQRPPAEDEDWPVGMIFSAEATWAGPDNQVTRHFLTLPKKEGEAMDRALSRLRQYVARVKLPKDREVGFQRMLEADDQARDIETGFRTFVIVSTADIDSRAIASAKRANPPKAGVEITLTPEATQKLTELSGAWLKRRIALVLDGEIVATELVEGRMANGRLSLPLPETRIPKLFANGASVN